MVQQVGEAKGQCYGNPDAARWGVGGASGNNGWHSVWVLGSNAVLAEDVLCDAVVGTQRLLVQISATNILFSQNNGVNMNIRVVAAMLPLNCATWFCFI